MMSWLLEERLELGEGRAGQVAGGAVEVGQPDAFGEVQVDVGEVGLEGSQDSDRLLAGQR